MTKETEKQLSRRAVLKAGLTVAAVGMSAGVAAQSGKIAPSMVQYQASPKDGHECDLCAQFVAPDSCKVVDGKISPKGYCVAFAPKS